MRPFAARSRPSTGRASPITCGHRRRPRTPRAVSTVNRPSKSDHPQPAAGVARHAQARAVSTVNGPSKSDHIPLLLATPATPLLSTCLDRQPAEQVRSRGGTPHLEQRSTESRPSTSRASPITKTAPTAFHPPSQLLVSTVNRPSKSDHLAVAAAALSHDTNDTRMRSRPSTGRASPITVRHCSSLFAVRQLKIVGRRLGRQPAEQVRSPVVYGHRNQTSCLDSQLAEQVRSRVLGAVRLLWRVHELVSTVNRPSKSDHLAVGPVPHGDTLPKPIAGRDRG